MKFKTALMMGISILCFSSAVLATQIGVVDMQKIFKNSPSVKAESAKLNKQFAARRASMMQMEQKLQKSFADLQKNSAVMSKKSLAAKRQSAAQQEAKLREMQQQFQHDVLAAQNKAMVDFMQKAGVAAKTVAAKHKLDVILLKNAVLYSAGVTDITDELMKDLA